MIIAALVVLGLILGSFVNALIWRWHEQEVVRERKSKKKADKQYLADLSMVKGRSMCSHCHHELAPKDLVPVISWLMLGGKCRYCRVKIQDNPLVEVGLPILFVVSYVYWPLALHSLGQRAVFGLWLLELVVFVALAAYDLRWMLLPTRLIYVAGGLGLLQAIITLLMAADGATALLQLVLAVLVGGGVFYVLFQLSAGKWIGGGDVRLGWVLGLTAGTAVQSMLFIFIAALSGTLLSLPLMVNGKLKKGSVIPFGPLLILGAVVVRLFGASLWAWYRRQLGV